MADTAPQRIYLARHGETEWNVAKRGQARLDSPLTARGIDLAKRLGTFARDQRIGLVLSSPLGRALRTSELAAATTGATVLPLRELAEVDHGRLAGLTAVEIEQRMPRALVDRARDKFHWSYPDGESYDSALPRARQAVKVAAGSGTDRALIVSHEMVGRLLRMVLLDLPPQHAMTLSQPHDVVFEIAEGKVIEHRLG